MSDLDEKLREILKQEIDLPIEYGEGVSANYYGIDFDGIIAHIKQVLADARWMQAPYLTDKTKTLEIPTIGYGTLKFMTGLWIS